MTDYSDTQALNEFVHTHKLMDRKGHIMFSALVSITTVQQKLRNRQMDIMVRFDGYDNLGTLTLMENDLDNNLFPTRFNAKWQKFEHVAEEHLLIKGTHTQNPNIGKYEVKVIPLS
jgi:hypothetical protein